MAIPGFSLLMVTVPISATNSLTMPELMISLSYASLHIPLMPSKVSYLAPSLRSTDSTLLALDILGFSQFKHAYAQVLDGHACENFGAMNKHTYLQAIEKPFLKSFTADKIKKSFEIVGLHPLDPDVIRTSQMAPSTTSLTDEPSPVKAMKAAFTSLLDTATLPIPSMPTLHIEPDPSLPTPAPPAMPSTTANDPSTPSHMTSPQKVAQEHPCPGYAFNKEGQVLFQATVTGRCIGWFLSRTLPALCAPQPATQLLSHHSSSKSCISASTTGHWMQLICYNM